MHTRPRHETRGARDDGPDRPRAVARVARLDDPCCLRSTQETSSDLDVAPLHASGCSVAIYRTDTPPTCDAATAASAPEKDRGCRDCRPSRTEGGTDRGRRSRQARYRRRECRAAGYFVRAACSSVAVARGGLAIERRGNRYAADPVPTRARGFLPKPSTGSRNTTCARGRPTARAADRLEVCLGMYLRARGGVRSIVTS
jgi:hypothetical protein